MMTSPGGAADTIAVAIVNHETVDLLERCLRSVIADGATSVVVVDHASTDGSAAMVREVFPDVDLRAHPDNPGYGAGVNRGMASTTAPWLLVLNSDTELVPGCLDALARHVAHHPEAHVLGPRLSDLDGSVQRSCYPEPTVPQLLIHDLGLLPVLARLPLLAERHPHTASYDRVRSADWVLGAALCLRRDTWEALGGFDEDYGMYFEEVDFCRRVRAVGGEVQLVPDAEVIHVGGASTDAYRDALTRRYFASRARYHRRHLGAGSVALLRLETALVAGAQWLRERLRLATGAGDHERATTFGHVLRDAVTGWRAIDRWSA